MKPQTLACTAGFFVGRCDTFRVMDRHGIVTVQGEITRMEQIGQDVYAAIRLEGEEDVTRRYLIHGPRLDVVVSERAPLIGPKPVQKPTEPDPAIAGRIARVQQQGKGRRLRA